MFKRRSFEWCAVCHASLACWTDYCTGAYSQTYGEFHPRSSLSTVQESGVDRMLALVNIRGLKKLRCLKSVFWSPACARLVGWKSGM